MYNETIIVVFVFSVIILKCTDCAVVYQCYKYSSTAWEIRFKNDAVTNIWCEHQCKANASSYQYSGTILNTCYCRKSKPFIIEQTAFDYSTSKIPCRGDTSEICGCCYESDERITVSKIEQTINAGFSKSSLAWSDSPSTMQTSRCKANGEWSLWNDWKFCEVNCVQEDTTEGTQQRWRTCNGSNCSGEDMEERSCLRPGICKGMRPRKLLCKCPKRLINTKWHNLDGKNITDAEVKKIVFEDFNKNIKSEMSVDEKTVSKEVRKKISSVNKRKSAQSIGWGCIVFLVLPVVFLIAIDFLNCCIHFRKRLYDRRRNQISPTHKIQDQIDSSKPLQENVKATESYYGSRCGNDFHPDEMKRETYQRRRDDNNQIDKDEWLQYI